MKNTDYKLIARYLAAGIFTTAVNVISFFILIKIWLDPENPAELWLAGFISWLFSVIFSYIISKTFVFQSPEKSVFGKFILSRLLSLSAESGFLFVFVSLLNFTPYFSKGAAQIMLIVLNFLISRRIFRKNT